MTTTHTLTLRKSSQIVSQYTRRPSLIIPELLNIDYTPQAGFGHGRLWELVSLGPVKAR